MDQSLWQTPESIDFIYSSNKWIQTVLLCGYYCKTMQTGIVSRLRFLQEILRNQNPLLEEHCAFLEVIHLFQKVGCVRNKLQFHTVQQNPKSWLDAWLRFDGIPALDLWDRIVLGNMTQTTERPGRPVIIDRSQRSQGKTNALSNIECVPSNVQSSRQEVLLSEFEDNEAVIKMISKGRSPTMRHVTRTHRVALDWLFDRINLDPKDSNQVHRYQKPTRWYPNQRKFHTWWVELRNYLLCLFNISRFSFTVFSETMAKRSQHDSGEERVTAKSRQLMNLIARAPSNVSSSTSVSPGREVMEVKIPGVQLLRKRSDQGDLISA